jgi:hypothetical protein
MGHGTLLEGRAAQMIYAIQSADVCSQLKVVTKKNVMPCVLVRATENCTNARIGKYNIVPYVAFTLYNRSVQPVVQPLLQSPVSVTVARNSCRAQPVRFDVRSDGRPLIPHPFT